MKLLAILAAWCVLSLPAALLYSRRLRDVRRRLRRTEHGL